MNKQEMSADDPRWKMFKIDPLHPNQGQHIVNDQATLAGEMTAEVHEPTDLPVTDNDPGVESPAEPPVKNVRMFRAGLLANTWKCSAGHILGMIIQEDRGGAKIPRLLKLPVAVTEDQFIPENLMCSKIDAGEIVCTICGTARPWRLSPKLAGHTEAGVVKRPRKRNPN